MSAPSVGQLVFVARPQVNGGGFDPGLVLANLGPGLFTPGLAFNTSILLFSTATVGGTVTTMTITADVYPNRASASSQAPGNLTQQQSASVL
jgi:hypothetical protein